MAATLYVHPLGDVVTTDPALTSITVPNPDGSGGTVTLPVGVVQLTLPEGHISIGRVEKLLKPLIQAVLADPAKPVTIVVTLS